MEDAQKIRMAMGNHICASFRLEMGTAEDEKEAENDPEKVAEEDEKKKLKIMKELMTEFNRITDVYVDIFKSRGKIDKVIKEVSDIKYIKNSYDYALLEGYNKMLETEELAKNFVDNAVKNVLKQDKQCGNIQMYYNY